MLMAKQISSVKIKTIILTFFLLRRLHGVTVRPNIYYYAPISSITLDTSMGSRPTQAQQEY